MTNITIEALEKAIEILDSKQVPKDSRWVWTCKGPLQITDANGNLTMSFEDMLKVYAEREKGLKCGTTE